MKLMDLAIGDFNYSKESENELGATDEGAPNFNDVDTEEEDEDFGLEIYQKAKKFNSLKLLSGNGMSDSELTSFVSEHYGTRGLQRLKLAKFILKSLKYNPSPDVLLMLSSTKKARIVIATAGAGKTTSLQFDLLISKILDKTLGENLLEPEVLEGTDITMSRVLYLNYNKHNVQPIVERHSRLCAAVNSLLTADDAVENSIDSSTVHAFCYRWLQAFSSEVSLPELKILTEEEKAKIWKVIIAPRWTKYYGESPCTLEYTVLDELYNYKTESMLDWDEFFETAKFVDSGLNEKFVKACIKKYDSMKKQMKLLDFTDYLILMIETLKANPKLKEKLQKRYRIIIADENQDFTRLMNELLIQLYDPKVNQVVIVGDPDQTIYAFKGVSPDNIAVLSEQLEDVELLGLDTNYRCPDKIVEAAKEILNLNILRFKKPIETIRTGGKIIAHPLQTSDSQEKSVLQLLQRIGKNEWGSTVISYRNNLSSIVLAEELYYANIPFTILDTRRPFSNMVFNQITRALRALQEKDNLQLNQDLYRFLPIDKEFWHSILEDNRLQRRFHLHDLKVPNRLPNGTMDALRTLVQISERFDYPVCDFIAPLLNLYRTYYFNFMVRQPNPVISDNENLSLFLDRTYKFYNRQQTFDYMMKELSERNRDNPAGVTLSTFHGLKGLEFDYVIAIDFNETTFPNYVGIEQRYSKNTAIEEKESENRLCYVLVTRSIKEFHMFYSATDPSTYVGLLTRLDNKKIVSEPETELALGNIRSGSDMFSKSMFVQRILNGR